MLTIQRKKWWEKFQDGERPELLEAYEKIRDSELERMSAQVEKLAEYALNLERKLKCSDHELTLCSVCNQPVTSPHYECAHDESNSLINQALRAWKTGEKK